MWRLWGYGPVGATLANLLGQYGCKTIVIERDYEIYPVPRAVHADAETLRIFQAVGLQTAMQPALGIYHKREYLTANGDIFFETLVSDQQPYGHREDIYFHQPTLEGVLRQGTERYDHVEVCLGYEVEEVTAQATGVSFTARNLTDNTVEVFRAKYLVGCDGARSTIRKELDFPLRDLGFDQPWLVVDVYLKDGVTAAEAKIPNCHRQYCNPGQPITFVPTAVKGHYRWEFMLLGGQIQAEVEQPENVRRLLSQVVDLNHVDVVRAVVYTFHALVAERWRKEQVFIAGDAAHQMPPFAGQGMCSGLRDVHNLSWKLALVLAGKSEERLLDTYQQERAPHVTRMTKGTMLLGNLIQTRHPLRAFLRDILFKTILRVPALFGRIAHFTLRSPALKQGVLGGDIFQAAGTFFIQPPILTHTGERVLLDEVLGSGFAVLGLNQLPLVQEFEFGDRLPVVCLRVVSSQDYTPSVTPKVATVVDVEGALLAWFQHLRGRLCRHPS